MGWGSSDMDVRMGLPGVSTSVSSSLERQMLLGGGGGGSQERGGSDRLGISEKASRGERCALILRRYSLQSWETGKKGGVGRATQPAGLCSQLREAV